MALKLFLLIPMVKLENKLNIDENSSQNSTNRLNTLIQYGPAISIFSLGTVATYYAMGKNDAAMFMAPIVGLGIALKALPSNYNSVNTINEKKKLTEEEIEIKRLLEKYKYYYY